MADVDERAVDEPDFDAESGEVVEPVEGDRLDELTIHERDALNDAEVSAYDRAPDDGEEFDLLPAFLEWVEEHLSVVDYTHSDRSTAAWCPEWWKHPEPSSGCGRASKLASKHNRMPRRAWTLCPTGGSRTGTAMPRSSLTRRLARSVNATGTSDTSTTPTGPRSSACPTTPPEDWRR